MAAHYDTAVVPARPRKPRDKAKVEVAVQVATRWIIAKLRNRRSSRSTRLTLPSASWWRNSTTA
jgi:transposase